MVPRIQTVIDSIIVERRHCERFCRALSPEELARPVPSSAWRVQDFISHVVTLDAPYRGWFHALAGGSATDLHRGSVTFDVDAYNAVAVAARHGRAVAELFDEGARERAALIAVLERLTDAQLDATIRFSGDGKRPPVRLPLHQFLQGWVRHDAIHLADILKALPERRADPALRGWLDQPDLAAAIGSYQRAMQ